MSPVLDPLEHRRLELQENLDRQKSSAERNKLGQFATPTDLARDIVAYGVSLLPPQEAIRFLDPAIGTGAFYSALRAVCANGRIADAVGYEIDPHYGLHASELWRGTELNLLLADFTQQESDPRFNLVICNPPYVRHHHLLNKEKIRLQHRTKNAAGIRLSGLAGLYCHFLGLAHSWMTENAVAGWLIPSEFMDVNYGSAIKHYLLDNVTLLHIHRFDPNEVQFTDALVSSAVVWLKNAPPPRNHHIAFTFGGSLSQPQLHRTISSEVLRREIKWTRFPLSEIRPVEKSSTLGDLFSIKRGIATGRNSYFILSEEAAKARKISQCVLRPILPSPRYIPQDVIESDEAGYPLLDKRLVLIDTQLDERDIRLSHPALWSYLQEGRKQGVHERYLCRHRRLWYTQEQRPSAPIVCTYLGRGSKRNNRPFRFIRNLSKATVANVYLAMYPKPSLQRLVNRDPSLLDRIWQTLNATNIANLLDEGRVYGGGLHKLEPRELGNVVVAGLADVLPVNVYQSCTQQNLFAMAGGEV